MLTVKIGQGFCCSKFDLFICASYFVVNGEVPKSITRILVTYPHCKVEDTLAPSYQITLAPHLYYLSPFVHII